MSCPCVFNTINSYLISLSTMARIKHHVSSSKVQTRLISANLSSFGQHPVLDCFGEFEVKLLKALTQNGNFLRMQRKVRETKNEHDGFGSRNGRGLSMIYAF